MRKLFAVLIICFCFASLAGFSPRLHAAAPKVFTAADLGRYAAEIAPFIAGRSLSLSERQRIDAGQYQAFEQILREWTTSPSFPRIARQMITELTRAAGQSDSFEADLPGNLAEYLARERLPYSQLLTASSCYNKSLQPIACDTGAPYTAGLLTTRSYLRAHASRFNLSRAISMVEEFLCMSYPMPDNFQPREAMNTLINLFARDPDTPEKDVSSFGFGRAHCYSCHGQFAPHTQLFVRFDRSGLYRAAATGQQNPALQPGESGTAEQLLYTSHFRDPQRSSQEYSQMLGQPVQNLAEAAQVLRKTKEFKACAVRRVLSFGARLERSQVSRIQDADVEKILGDLGQISADPSFSDYFYAVFKDPRVITAMLRKI